MLVLSRHRDESIILSAPGMPRIRITVVDLRGDKVRLGIEAPIEVICHREEVAERIEAELRTGRDPGPRAFLDTPRPLPPAPEGGAKKPRRSH